MQNVIFTHAAMGKEKEDNLKQQYWSGFGKSGRGAESSKWNVKKGLSVKQKLFQKTS